MTARNLTLAFFSPTVEDDWMNRLVARVSKYPYCHIELYFESTNQCFSILYGGKAELRTKTLQSPCYEIVTLGVTLQEYDACLNFCRNVSKQTITFDNIGMILSWFKLGFTKKDKTFCSKIICEALQYAKVEEVKNRLAYGCTPSRLYGDVMHSKRRICASVPYKCEQMLKKKVIQFQNKVYVRVYDTYT